MDAVLIVVVALVFLGVGFAVGRHLGRLAAAAESAGAAQARLLALTGELAGAKAQAAAHLAAAAAAAAELAPLRRRVGEDGAALASLQAELQAERRAAVERAELAERSREQVRAELEKLASRIIDEKGRALLDRGQEGLAQLLKPVSERLQAFEARIETTYKDENRDRASLLRSLEILQETQGKLHADAEALSRALTGDSKSQGDWGELVLERVLETAGLTRGREYDLQVDHVDDEGGHKRPDALVFLPGNRAIVVDAKCSLTAFVEAGRAATPEAREAALAAHAASLRAHVKGLAGKSYTEVLAQRTLDIVLLFVPNEAAFHAALSRAPGLYEEAFRQGVVVCSPTTLLAALQLVSHVWRSEKQNQHAQQIAEEAGKLLEKLSGFVEDLDGLGTRLRQAQESWAAARGKLADGKGNLLGKARALVRLGARVRADKVAALGGPAEGEEDQLELPAGPASGRGAERP